MVDLLTRKAKASSVFVQPMVRKRSDKFVMTRKVAQNATKGNTPCDKNNTTKIYEKVSYLKMDKK